MRIEEGEGDGAGRWGEPVGGLEGGGGGGERRVSVESKGRGGDWSRKRPEKGPEKRLGKRLGKRRSPPALLRAGKRMWRL